MKKLLNTLYISSPGGYLSLDGKIIVIINEGEEKGRLPLHNFDSIISMGYRGVSPALMGECCKQGITINFLSPYGKFLARISGPVQGNVVLRRKQFSTAADEGRCFSIARSFITGKLFNSRWVIERTLRDHPMRIDEMAFRNTSEYLKRQMFEVRQCKSPDTLRGIEGLAVKRYFSVFNDMILQQKDDFRINGRNRRPPTDKVNALLSFSYSLLTAMCASALETVGLDPYVGFMHKDRSGRKSLALDLVEELRSVYADKFVLHLINDRIIGAKHFIEEENRTVLLTDEGRRIFFNQWQNKKKKEIKHPYLNEKVEWGMVPYVQALLLAWMLRGDLDEYPTFMWK